MADRLYQYGAPLGGYIDPVTGKLSMTVGGPRQVAPDTPMAPVGATPPVDANLITAPGMGAPGPYPEPLAKLRQWFDPETYGPTGGATWEQPSALLPMAQHPGPGGRPEEKFAIPRAIKEGAQFGLDLLASPWTGGVPESTVGNAVTNALFRYGAGATQPAGVLETFMGKTGQKFPHEQAKLADQMLKEGIDRSTVYRTTGVGRMKATGKNQFFEISDAPEAGVEYHPGRALNDLVDERISQMNPREKEIRQQKAVDAAYGADPEVALQRMVRAELENTGYQTTLGKMMTHPELYSNRPDIADLPVHIGPRGQGAAGTSLGKGYSGAYLKDAGRMEIAGDYASNLDKGKSIILHELGHKIQGDEGWPKGGNIAEMGSRYLSGGFAANVLGVRNWIKKHYPGMDPATVAYQIEKDFGPIGDPRRPATLKGPEFFQALDPTEKTKDIQARARIYKAGKGFKPEERAGQLYRGLAGEWLSRMTERRAGMGPQELRDYAPWDQSQLIGETPEAAQILVSQSGKEMSQGQKAPEKGKPGNLFFDFGRPEAKPTGRGIVPQQELPRFMAKSTKKYPTGYSERMEAALGNSKLETALKRLTEQGIEMGGQVWYDAEPLRQAFVSRLGEEKGTFEFNRLMQFVGATSPQQKVPFNVRTATAYYIRDRHIREGRPGAAEMPVPWQVGGKGNWKGDITEGRRMPSPYGGYTQGLWQTYAQNVHHGRDWPLTAPKPPSFAANLTGNIKAYTVDMHDFKQIGILSGDPRFLTSDALKRGVTPKTAGPEDWVDVPNIDRGEYVGAETLGQRLASYFGIPEAHVQAARWIAGGKLTGLGSDASKSFMDFVMDRLEHTAKARKISPIEALNRLIDGDEALLAETGLRPGMGQYLAGEKKQPPPTGNRLLQTVGSRS